MMKIHTLFQLALCGALLTTTAAFGQALPDGDPDAAEVDQENPLSVWLHSIQRMAPHRALSERAGTWAVVYRSWYEPGGSPVEVVGFAERSMILEGRVLEEELTVQMPGREYKGVSHVGYDNVNERYWWRRLDNFSTWETASVDSTFGEEGAIHFEVPILNHVDGTSQIAKIVLRTEADREIYEWHQPSPDGEIFKSIEYEYTRTDGGAADEEPATGEEAASSADGAGAEAGS